MPQEAVLLAAGGGGREDSTMSSGSFQVDPFDSVNHFLECKIVKGKSYSCPVLLIAKINRHN